MNLLELSKILFFSSFIIWLVPPIRQYNNRFFNYFLLLAISDIISLFFIYLMNVNLSGIIFSTTSILIILSLLEKDTVKRYYVIFIIIIVINIVINIVHSTIKLYMSIVIVNYLIITLIILKKFILEYVEAKRINLFLVILIFYMSTSLIKIFNILIGFADATAFFIITTIAQIAFGLFFSIFREDNPKLMVKL